MKILSDDKRHGRPTTTTITRTGSNLVKAPLTNPPTSPAGAAASLELDPVEILQELIAIPSVNPMGKECSGAEYFEFGMTSWLVDFFRRLDVEYEVQEVTEGRCNVVARLNADEDAPTIMLDAHQDTVPVDGMTIAPFAPVIKEGRLYGRGACDVKGGMAAMLTAFARLATERPAGRANVIMSCSCDEEFSAQGARFLAKRWQDAGATDSLVSSPPDFCVVAEPTDLNVIVAHRGVVRWKVETRGIACHSSRPHEGRSAIYDMAQVIQALQRYADDLPRRVGAHPLCGTPTLSVGRILGGTSVNIVPEHCEIEIDRRTSPGERADQVWKEIDVYLRQETDANFVMQPPWIDADSLSDETNQAWADRLIRHIQAVSGPCEKQGAWYCTNASSFDAGGVPSVVYGPGSIAQAHTADEWIEIEQLRQASETYYLFCADPGSPEMPA